MRKMIALASLAAALSIGAVPAAASASTSPSDPSVTSDTSTLAGTAPDCISRTFVGSKIVQVINSCSTPMSVNVVIDYGPDSGCYYLPRHDGFNYSWTIGTYARVETC
ncbi:hypothetical protein GCM10027187_39920 [Streptosporangium sandarakinum]